MGIGWTPVVLQRGEQRTGTRQVMLAVKRAALIISDIPAIRMYAGYRVLAVCGPPGRGVAGDDRVDQFDGSSEDFAVQCGEDTARITLVGRGRIYATAADYRVVIDDGGVDDRDRPAAAGIDAATLAGCATVLSVLAAALVKQGIAADGG